MSVLQQEIYDRINTLDEMKIRVVLEYIDLINIDYNRKPSEKEEAYKYLKGNTYKIDIPSDYDYKKEYKNSKIKVITPMEFIKNYQL